MNFSLSERSAKMIDSSKKNLTIDGAEFVLVHTGTC